MTRLWVTIRTWRRLSVLSPHRQCQSLSIFSLIDDFLFFRCGATDYPLSSLAPYTIASNQSATATGNAAATSAAQSATSTCNTKYTIKSGDTCNSVSIAQNVSTFSLLYQNGLQGYCTNFPSNGSLCLLPPCNIYTVKANDTCYGLMESLNNGFSISQLVSWNLNINRDCSNLDQIVGYQICVR